MALFQNECEEIARWNSDRIHDEVRVLIEKTGCDYMEELMTAVFIAHTKVLTAVRLSKKQQELSITVPKLDHFIHRVFRETARCFWKTPFLFHDIGGVIDRQKNILQIEALATEAITTAVRTLLPVKQILQRYLEADTEEIEEDETVTTEAVKETATATAATEATAAAATATAAAAATEVEKAPSVVNIETEPSVTFSDYDTVFDEKAGRPEMRYSPKESGSGGDDEEEDEEEDSPSDAIEVVGEATSLDDTDAEDLESPTPKPKASTVNASLPPKKMVSETIGSDEFISLD